MKNEIKIIAKFFTGKLPEPEIPADDAWEKMNDMLNTEMPAGQAGRTFNGFSGSALKLISALVLVGLSVVGVVLYLNKNVEKDFGKNKKAAESKSEILAVRAKHELSANDIPKINESVTEQAKIEESPTIKEAFTEKEAAENRITLHDKINDPAESKAAPKSFKKPKGSAVDLNNVDKKKLESKKVLSKRDADFINRTKIINEKAAHVKSANAASNVQERSKNQTANTLSAPTDNYKRKEAESLLSLKSLSSLKSLPFKPSVLKPDFSKKILAKQNAEADTVPKVAKERAKNAFAVGLEWNLNAPLKQTDFLFNSLDSVKKPATLLIPGIWITKSYRGKHFITLSLATNQPYFGNNIQLAQVTDTINSIDSSYWHRNTNLIKTIGLNVALQYQFQFINHFQIGAGVVYSRTLGALVHVQTFGRDDALKGSKYVTLRGAAETNPYLNANIFQLKAGVSYEVGRFQAGINILVPVNNVSASPQYPIRAVNGQLFLRFRVW